MARYVGGDRHLAGAGLPLSELAIPDLDLIKQEEQGCATGAGGYSLAPLFKPGAGYGSLRATRTMNLCSEIFDSLFPGKRRTAILR